MLVEVQVSLKQILVRLKKLADDGKEKSPMFNRAYDEYQAALIEFADRNDRLEARHYLATIKSIGSLNIADMKEQLECE